MLGFAMLAGSAALLVAGAELFAEHAAGAARRLGVTTLAVGILLAGAEPEELVTAVVAALRDRPGLAAGDALGANVTMLTLVLGLAALLRPVPLGATVRAYAVGAFLTGGVAALLVRDGDVTRPDGLVLVGSYAVFVAVVWRRERRAPAVGEVADALDAEAERPVPALALALGGIGIMMVGGRVAVAGAERVVDALDAADSAVGLTFVALATTAELLALVWSAARRRLPELAVAGVLGSAAYNSTVTLGGAGLARPLATGGVGGAAVLAAGLPLALAVTGRVKGGLARPVGVALLCGYAAYLWAVL